MRASNSDKHSDDRGVVDALVQALSQFKGALLVVPASTKNPGIGERIRGMSLASLERLGVPVIVAV